MNDFIISVDAISQKEILKRLDEYIASLPDADRWSQYFAASTGQITKELIAGFGAYLKQDSISSRRENYLPYAQSRGHVVGGAQSLGYSVFRGRNALVEITFTPSSTGVYPKYYQLGSVSGYGLILLEETTHNSGTPLTVTCAVGDIKDQTLQAQNGNKGKFRFTEKRVSNDVRIFIGSTEIEVSTDIREILNDLFYIQTNTVGSVDALFLNRATAAAQYTSGSNVRLEWIELRDISFSESNVSIDETEGTLSNVAISALYQEPETNQSIQISAPLENDTKRLLRARNDYSKLLLQFSTDFIAAGGQDTAVAAIYEVFALKNDLSVLSTSERQDFISFIESSRTFGVRPPKVIDPVPYFLDLNISLHLVEGVQGDPETLVENIISPYEKILSNPEEVQELDFKLIEAQITALDIVQISRVLVAASAWASATSYRRGQHVLASPDTGFIYEATEFVRYGNSSEPTWPEPVALTPPQTGFQYGQTVNDFEIVWESVEKNASAPDWQADSVYRVGDTVNPTGQVGNDPDASYRVLRVLSRSGKDIAGQAASVTYQGVTFTADNVGEDGNLIELVFDGADTITAVVDDWNFNNPNNTVSHNGTGSDVLTAGTADLQGGTDPISGEPSWPIPADASEPDSESFTDDNQILWLMIEKVGTPNAWQQDTVYEIGDVVIPSNVQSGQENIAFQAVAYIGKTSNSQPSFPTSLGNSVIDGGVVWVARGKEAAPISPNLTEYYLINQTVSLI